MALKPTIYKAQIELADSDREVYQSLSTTIALHPSETVERMTARLLAYCLNWQRGLEFSRGLSTSDEPDLWRHSDSGEIEQWIEVGQPETARLRKACGRAKSVSVYAFAASTDTWWKRCSADIATLPHTDIWQFNWKEISDVAASLIARSMQLSVSVVGGTLYLDNGDTSHSLEARSLHSSAGD